MFVTHKGFVFSDTMTVAGKAQFYPLCVTDTGVVS